jgi:hypothetical protein
MARASLGIYTPPAVVDGRGSPRWRPGRGSPASWRSPARRAGRDEDEDVVFALIRAKRYTGWAGP